MTYPKRLIEVDLPIKRISELCAALWPDPACSCAPVGQ